MWIKWNIKHLHKSNWFDKDIPLEKWDGTGPFIVFYRDDGIQIMPVSIPFIDEVEYLRKRIDILETKLKIYESNVGPIIFPESERK